MKPETRLTLSLLIFLGVIAILLLFALSLTHDRFKDYQESTTALLGEKDAYIKQLEREADIWGDTWRESDCGIQISEENNWRDIDNNLSEIKEMLRCKDGMKAWNITFYYRNGTEAEEYKQQFCS